MHGPLYQFLADDHTRLAGLLQRATAHLGEIDQAAYTEFRAGLLKHISMEEKGLLPTVQRAETASRIRSQLGCAVTMAP